MDYRIGIIIIIAITVSFALIVISEIIKEEEKNTIYCDEAKYTKLSKCEYCDTWQHLNDSGRCSNCNAELEIRKEK